MPDAQRFIPFARPDVGEDEARAVADAIRSGWITSGPRMREFEEQFRLMLGHDVQAIAVNSATSGLHLALEALGIGPGDEVIVPTWTFTATAEVVRYLGARPVFVDIETDSLNISLDSVATAVTRHTRAIIPVHFAGLQAPIADLARVLDTQSIAILEDAAHALPTAGNSGVVGDCQHSRATVFSFYATKTMTTGEGGMVCTSEPGLADRMRIMRLHGIDRDSFDRYTSKSANWHYDVVAPGFKYNMPDTAAAMGQVQLSRLHGMRQRRASIAAHYLESFSDLPLTLPMIGSEGSMHAWHLFVVRMLPASRICRDEFIERMAEEGIGTSMHFLPLHLHTYWKEFAVDAQRRLTNATREAPLAVSLPISSALTDTEVERIVASVTKALS